jgi:predicted RNA-binding protein associated with RNAse of E/G family
MVKKKVDKVKLRYKRIREYVKDKTQLFQNDDSVKGMAFKEILMNIQAHIDGIYD